MPDEFKKYDPVEDMCKTLNGNRYYHDLYLKAVNNPIRREILNIVNKANKISKVRLFNILSEKEILKDVSNFEYNIDFLIKALCLEKEIVDNEIFYVITQSGKVIEYL